MFSHSAFYCTVGLQMLDHGHWIDLLDTSRLNLLDVLLVAAMGPPGGGTARCRVSVCLSVYGSNYVDGCL